MTELKIIVFCTIHDGQRDAFKKIAADCLESVKTKDRRTERYEWFFNEDESVCAVLERYPDSDALLEHIANLGDIFGDLLTTCDMRVDMYGKPSEALLKATEGIPVTVYDFFQGA